MTPGVSQNIDKSSKKVTERVDMHYAFMIVNSPSVVQYDNGFVILTIVAKIHGCYTQDIPMDGHRLSIHKIYTYAHNKESLSFFITKS